MEGGNYGVGQLPDLALGILKRTVAVDHDFNMLAGLLQQSLLDVLHQRLAVTGEQFNSVLSGLVGTQQTILLVVAVVVNGGRQNIVQTQDHFSAGLFQNALGTLAGVDITGQNVFRIAQNHAGIIGKQHFYFSAGITDQVTVVSNVVHTGEGVLVLAEELTINIQSQYVLIGIHAGSIQLIPANQLIAHLVRGIGQHQDDLLGSHGDAAQANGKTVAGQDGHNHTDGFAAQFGLHISGNGVYAGVVSLRTGHDGLGNTDYVTITQLKTFAFSRFQNTVDHDITQVITFTDDGAANTSGNSTDFTFHINNSFSHKDGSNKIDTISYHKTLDLARGNSTKLPVK